MSGQITEKEIRHQNAVHRLRKRIKQRLEAGPLLLTVESTEASRLRVKVLLPDHPNADGTVVSWGRSLTLFDDETSDIFGQDRWNNVLKTLQKARGMGANSAILFLVNIFLLEEEYRRARSGERSLIFEPRVSLLEEVQSQGAVMLKESVDNVTYDEQWNQTPDPKFIREPIYNFFDLSLWWDGASGDFLDFMTDETTKPEGVCSFQFLPHLSAASKEICSEEISRGVFNPEHWVLDEDVLVSELARVFLNREPQEYGNSFASAPPFKIGCGPRPNFNSNSFRLSGDVWQITYEKLTFTLKDRVGLRYIAELLSKPGIETPVAELMNYERSRTEMSEEELDATGLFIGDDESHDLVVDHIGQKAIRSQLQRYNEELLLADPERRLELQEAIEKLEKFSRKDLNHIGRSRGFSDRGEKDRKAVSNAITDARNIIRKHHPSLYEHLCEGIKGRGRSFEYNKKTAVVWLIDAKVPAARPFLAKPSIF